MRHRKAAFGQALGLTRQTAWFPAVSCMMFTIVAALATWSGPTSPPLMRNCSTKQVFRCLLIACSSPTACSRV